MRALTCRCLLAMEHESCSPAARDSEYCRPVERSSDYCSEFCEGALYDAREPCNCGHPDCEQETFDTLS
jgi:hypothetical protein